MRGSPRRKRSRGQSEPPKGLRWHAQVRTTNGAITTGIRIRARNAHEAVDRAQAKAYREHRNLDRIDVGGPYNLKDWHVIYIGLHTGDHNSLEKEEE